MVERLSRWIRDYVPRLSHPRYLGCIPSIVIEYSVILQTYTLSEILELNDCTEEEVLDFLVTQNFLELPEILPLEFDND